ncbi:hypothetical protein BUALT_Bualt05G0134500 [Buddleja alternifolia]|uniref:DNL-type domain-containing protein n=1 Tax=Buddleja alternifolia TaxID=168488 RepID=A0AAV6XQM9_9LAMI|nr:hypothetical protein BUALT_Bualt05G0134500 [Buddleja alternifolia]
MAAFSSCQILRFDYSICSIPKTHTKIIAPISSLPFLQSFRPNFGSNCKPFTLSRSRLRVPKISCLLEDNNEACPETEQSSVSSNSQQEAAIDLKLPRRSLLVTFTCDACGARSQRLINRLAYERGLVYVQCSGCSQYHKLVDNLGLVIEYNLQEEIDLDTNADQV